MYPNFFNFNAFFNSFYDSLFPFFLFFPFLSFPFLYIHIDNFNQRSDICTQKFKFGFEFFNFLDI